MSVNLSELGGQISWWLDRLNEQMDTSKLQKQVKESCCGKPFETKDKAIQVLVGLQDVLLKMDCLLTTQRSRSLLLRR